LAQAAMVVNLREAQIFKWHVSQLIYGTRDRNFPGAHTLQQTLDVQFVHGLMSDV
jgi:hypothetical protein